MTRWSAKGTPGGGSWARGGEGVDVLWLYCEVPVDFLWFSSGGGVSDIVSRVRVSTRTWKVFKVDGHEYFCDFGHDREVQENKLVTFSILKKYLDSEKLG